MKMDSQPKIPISTPFLQQRLLRVRSRDDEVLTDFRRHMLVLFFVAVAVAAFVVCCCFIVVVVVAIYKWSTSKEEDGEDQQLLTGAGHQVQELLSAQLKWPI